MTPEEAENKLMEIEDSLRELRRQKRQANTEQQTHEIDGEIDRLLGRKVKLQHMLAKHH
jgi:hypothetical protein